MTVPTESIVPAPAVVEPAAVETPVTPATPAAPIADPDKDLNAEVEKWKAMSRKHENENTKLYGELEKFKVSQMSESEKAIAEAKKEGRESALKELSADMAKAKIRAAATGKIGDVEAFLEYVDPKRFISEDGSVDDAAIAAAVERFSKVAPVPTKFGSVELGSQGDRPRQLGESDIKRMSPEQIVEARKNGQLDDALGITPR
jgi:hypothetical protein